jgi:hypothetical protein
VLRDAAAGRNSKGLALAARGRRDDAAAEFQEAISLNPDLSSAERSQASAQLHNLAILNQ